MFVRAVILANCAHAESSPPCPRHPQDEIPSKMDPSRLPSLRPAFRPEGGTLTAGNASALSDGAAAVVLASGAAVRRLGLKPLARVRGFADAAQDPREFTTAPAAAVRAALERSGACPRCLGVHLRLRVGHGGPAACRLVHWAASRGRYPSALALWPGPSGHPSDDTQPCPYPAVAPPHPTPAGVTQGEVEYWEVNEAFSVVDLANRQLLGLDADRQGGSGGGPSAGPTWDPQ